MRDYEDAEVQSERFRDRECESSSSGAVACKNACFSGWGRTKRLLRGRGRAKRLPRDGAVQFASFGGGGVQKRLPGRRGFVQLPFLKQDSTAMDFVRNIMP